MAAKRIEESCLSAGKKGKRSVVSNVNLHKNDSIVLILLVTHCSNILSPKVCNSIWPDGVGLVGSVSFCVQHF